MSILQNNPNGITSNVTPFLPGFEAFAYSKWKVPKAVDVCEGLESSEDKKLAQIINNPKLNLSDAQKRAVADFVETIANQTTATLGGIPDFERLKGITCRDYKNQCGGRCEVALQQGSDAHLIRYGWSVVIDSQKGEEQETVQFGITCLKRLTNLSKAETSLIRGLNSWVKDSSLRWLRKQFSAALSNNKSISEYTREWRSSFDFDGFQRAMQRVLSEPERFAYAYNNELTRIRFAGRTLSACKSAAFLLSAKLPVPYELVRRVLRGEKKLFR